MAETALRRDAPAQVAPILAFDELDSTNAEARRRAEAGETGPLWITARRQTAGRGRRGRAWETGPGNLAATCLLTTRKSAQEASQIAFVAALALADLADGQVPPALVTLKWPNDLMVAGQKAGGVLIESGSHTDGGLWLAVGVGVNLSTRPVAAERPATALQNHLGARVAKPLDAEAAARVLADAFARWLETWETYGFEPVRDAWTRRAHRLGQACTIRLDREAFEGVAEALEPDGALRLRLPHGGVRRITAGDVFFDRG